MTEPNGTVPEEQKRMSPLTIHKLNLQLMKQNAPQIYFI
jgi:hypothetical protein